MALIRPKSYEVLITPLIAKGVYGDVLDVSKDVSIDDYVNEKGISSIKREIDNGDFDYGVFVFDSVSIKCFNNSGIFSGANDSRSMFKRGRDKAKVTINFFDGKSNTPTSSFRGLVDDRATTLDFGKAEAKLKILSNDSIINRVKTPAGIISDGTSSTVALKALLQLPDILDVLNYDEANINPAEDILIEDGSFFDDRNVKDSLDSLLSVTNSVLIVDKDTDDIIVKDRSFNSGTVKNFYGHGDLFGRENIIDIKRYNNGLQRAFNTVTVGNISESDFGFIDLYGDNKKTVNYDFILDDSTKQKVAKAQLDQWKSPKIEMELLTTTEEAKGLNFFDLVSITYPYRVVPSVGNKLPLYGSAKYGESFYPHVFGNLKIRGNTAFKVVGMKEDPKKLLTSIKLRQLGTEIDDGYFSKQGTYYGTAIYGVSEYQYNPERIDPNTNSVFGAGKYGTVLYRA